MRTWNSVTQNFDTYQKAFGKDFISVVNDKSLEKGESQKALEDLVKKYIDPYKPTGTKPKTDKEQARSDKSREELNQQINSFINSDKIEDIKDSSVSKKEAKQEVKRFFS